MARDPLFATNPARVTNRVEMERALVEKTRLWKRDDLLAALEKAVVPAGPINTIADLFDDPQFQARGMRIEPQGTPGLRSPILMSDNPLALDRRSPRLGEHHKEILREIGLEEADGRRLTALGRGRQIGHEQVRDERDSERLRLLRIG